MIINNTPEHAVTLGGVTDVSEFRIRNSAKAFSILSSGLYANKICAIIRELSCNAVDSHVAAGKADAPFDLHLPTQLNPYFSIRDYGTGLSHREVLDIYTTYFESTKTESNDFIGALGLGSKSPFSYTDNFTVIAIKNGVKGVYSAFINDDGVPSVALMSQDRCDEANGVEVRFAVEHSDDFHRFTKEAAHVFTYFATKPNLTGAEVAFKPMSYCETDIIPGVSQRRHSNNSVNRAIMGNIAYPIAAPAQSLTQAEHWSQIDYTGLDLHFDIGELDFQASREGLQYTQQTLDAISKKYQAVSDALYTKLKNNVDQLDNVWHQSTLILERDRSRLWKNSANRYVAHHSLPFLSLYKTGAIFKKPIAVSTADLTKKYNIQIRAFYTNTPHWPKKHNRVIDLKPDCTDEYNISCDNNVMFVKNTSNEKIWNRCQHHFRTQVANLCKVYVIYAADASKPVKIQEFFDYIHNPPSDQILEVAQLHKPEPKKRASTPHKVTLLYINSDRHSGRMTWQNEVLTPKDMDTDTAYCYVPLKGHVAQLRDGRHFDAKDARTYMLNSGIKSLSSVKFYGVRQGDIKTVDSLPNWHHFEDFVSAELGALTVESFLHSALLLANSDFSRLCKDKATLSRINDNSPFKKFCARLSASSTKNSALNSAPVLSLSNLVALGPDTSALTKAARAQVKVLIERYPMLTIVRNRYTDEPIIAEYINFVDQQKGMN